MSIGFYPRYDRLGASSRYRFFMYFDRWLAEEMKTASAGCHGKCHICHNIACRSAAVHRGLSDEYLQLLYKGKGISFIVKAHEYLQLLMRAFNLEENLIIEYELVPGLPYSVEKLLIGDRPYVLNFDDNVWEKYRGKPLLEHKFDKLCQHAAGVIVANRYLFHKVRQFNRNVCLIPTVVDLDKYRSRNMLKYDRFTVVWIGTPITYRYLEENIAVLQAMSAAVDCEFLIVARADLGKKRPLPGIKARYVDWEMSREVEYLQRSHVGIMPLIDDEFARGKSAFKLIQYQAAGLPLLGSNVGENRHIIRHGGNGFLVDTPDEWAKALKILYSDKDAYDECVCHSRERAYNYSLQKYFPIYKDFILKSFHYFI